MNATRTRFSLLLGFCLLGAAPSAPAADWSDTFVGWRWGTNFHDPAVAPLITKNVVQFGHANRYSLGSNFLNVDVLMSNRSDPANGAGSGGAQEIYVTYRHQLSFGKAFKAKVRKGILRDVALTTGVDLNSKNTGFAPGKQALVVGPTVSFEIPKGFLDVGVWYYKEWNHNAFGIDKRADFDGTAMLNVSWGIPVPVGRTVSSSFKGFCNVIFPKGKDAALVQTETEVLSRTTWQFDLGAPLFGKKGLVSVGPGFELWYHKFGNPSPIPSGTATKPNVTTSAATIQAEIHF